MEEIIEKQLYHVFLFSMLITINIYFGIFVWMPSDLSPNLALLFCTLPFILMELMKIIKLNSQLIKKKQNGK